MGARSVTVRIRAFCVVAPLALSALFTGVAEAGVGASAVPSFPPTVTVGVTGIEATIELRNTNTDGNAGDTNTVCNEGDTSRVPGGQRRHHRRPVVRRPGPDAACTSFDPGVFAISPTAVGAEATACVGTTLNVEVADAATGAVRFTPRATHVLLPGAGATCRIVFTFAVLKSPAVDADPADARHIQTFQVAENAQHNGSLPAFARGTSVRRDRRARAAVDRHDRVGPRAGRGPAHGHGDRRRARESRGRHGGLPPLRT